MISGMRLGPDEKESVPAARLFVPNGDDSCAFMTSLAYIRANHILMGTKKRGETPSNNKLRSHAYKRFGGRRRSLKCPGIKKACIHAISTLAAAHHVLSHTCTWSRFMRAPHERPHVHNPLTAYIASSSFGIFLGM